MPSGYDPTGGSRFSLKLTNAERVCAEIMLKQKIERDDDSKKRSVRANVPFRAPMEPRSNFGEL